jgi:hypothetical protein
MKLLFSRSSSFGSAVGCLSLFGLLSACSGVRRLVQRLVLRPDHARSTERSFSRLRRAAPRRDLGDGSVFSQRIGSNDRARPEQPRQAFDLEARRSRRHAFRRKRVGLAVRSSSVLAGRCAGGGTQVHLRHLVLEPIEHRTPLRRSSHRHGAPSRDRISEDPLTARNFHA